MGCCHHLGSDEELNFRTSYPLIEGDRNLCFMGVLNVCKKPDYNECGFNRICWDAGNVLGILVLVKPVFGKSR